MPVVTDLQSQAAAAARQYNISPSFFQSLLQTESHFNPNAVSSAGAQGIGQLMPDTARAMGVTNPLDPSQNIQGSAKYFASLLNQFGGDYGLATAAYNAGPGRVSDFVNGIRDLPAETQNYIGKVFGGVPNFGGTVSDFLNSSLFGQGGLLNLGGIGNLGGLFGGSSKARDTALANNPISSILHFLVNLFSINTGVRVLAIFAGFLLLAAAIFVIAGGVKYVKQVGGTAVKGAVKGAMLAA